MTKKIRVNSTEAFRFQLLPFPLSDFQLSLSARLICEPKITLPLGKRIKLRVSECDANLFVIAKRTQATSPEANTAKPGGRLKTATQMTRSPQSLAQVFRFSPTHLQIKITLPLGKREYGKAGREIENSNADDTISSVASRVETLQYSFGEINLPSSQTLLTRNVLLTKRSSFFLFPL